MHQMYQSRLYAELGEAPWGEQPLKVEDDLGHPWLVLPGDAAADELRMLKSRGYEYVVLPRPLLCGTIDISSCEPTLQRRPPSSADPSNEGLVRAYRLFDCLTELRNELSNSNPSR